MPLSEHKRDLTPFPRFSRLKGGKKQDLTPFFDRHKLLAFVLSAALSGLAGATKTLVFGFETLTDVHWHTSGEVVLMTLLGGMGTVLGPVVGAFTIVTLQNELADKVGSWVTVIMGLIFVVCVLLFRRGIVGELAAWLKGNRSH